MSRSRKKTPVCGMSTAKSEKQDKRLANRKDRRKNKEILGTTQDDANLLPKKAISNVAEMDKDGKHRFDPEKHQGLMRK